ncbi:MAG: peptide-methionine (S)-S-oxide reductase MsrA [Rhodocyclaceae bacterium]|nr:MAG: peptide-methionine (S)-S-oxide reductase MsrA [Rhodocyclaceae bacterium]
MLAAGRRAALVLAALLGGSALAQAPASSPPTATAVFAGGCFWCLQADFDKLPGVTATEVGYTGGRTADPSYEQVSEGYSGHFEAVRVSYDPSRLAYGQLLDYFWRHIDPTNADGQFCDSGTPYRSAIFPLDETQRRAADSARDVLEKSGQVGPVFTLVIPAGPFYRAEEYHQNYYKNNPIRYGFYRALCGRDKRVKEIWGPKTSASAR